MHALILVLTSLAALTALVLLHRRGEAWWLLGAIVVAGIYFSMFAADLLFLLLHYGPARFWRENLYVESVRPRVAISNGDRPPDPQSLGLLLAMGLLWIVVSLTVVGLLEREGKSPSSAPGK